MAWPIDSANPQSQFSVEQVLSGSQTAPAEGERQTVVWGLVLVLVLCISPFLYDLFSASGWLAN